MMREATVSRKTKETEITISVNIDGLGNSKIHTPINFLNHMLEAFSKYSLIDLDIKASGDMEIDQHHTVEDIAIVLGRAINKALGDKAGIERAGYFIFPMDDALATTAIDLSGRPYLQFSAEFRRRFCGDLDTDLVEHFFESFAFNLKGNIVIRLENGKNDHHKLEAIFKSLGKSFKNACTINPRIENQILSTKGVID